MMELFVRSPIRAAGYFGKVLALIFLAAVLVGAPAWILLLILVGGLALYAQVSDRADRRAREHSPD
jgi:hypothetical protein